MKIDWQAILAVLAAVVSSLIALYRLWWNKKPKPIEERLDEMDTVFEKEKVIAAEADSVLRDEVPGPSDEDIRATEGKVNDAREELERVEHDASEKSEEEIDDKLKGSGFKVDTFE